MRKQQVRRVIASGLLAYLWCTSAIVHHTVHHTVHHKRVFRALDGALDGAAVALSVLVQRSRRAVFTAPAADSFRFVETCPGVGPAWAAGGGVPAVAAVICERGPIYRHGRSFFQFCGDVHGRRASPLPLGVSVGVGRCGRR